MGMASTLRNTWGWFRIIASSSALFFGCNLDREPYPGPPDDLECTIAVDPECVDDNPCTDNACSTYGECEHNKLATGQACGPSGNATCNSAGVCVGCAAGTATEDCGDKRFYCNVGTCALKAKPGQPCGTNDACSSGVCTAGGVCQ